MRNLHAVRRSGPAFPQLLTVRRIDESIGNIELGIERKEQGQSRRLARIDVIFQTGIPPGAARALIVPPVLSEDNSWRVVHEATERHAAEGFVMPLVENNSCHKSSATCDGIDTNLHALFRCARNN